MEVMMFPVSSILERRLCSVDRPSTFWFGCVLRCGLVLVTGVVVILIPNFSTMMALVGSSCCTLLALILPGTFHLMLFKGKLTTWSRVLDILLILLGVIGTIIGSIDALHRLFGKTTGLAIVNGTDSASGAIS